MKKGPFKLRSGNKPSMAKLAGVSPVKQEKKAMMTSSFTETPTEETLKKYRAAMAKDENERTPAEIALIKKVNEIRAKQQNKAGLNTDETD